MTTIRIIDYDFEIIKGQPNSNYTFATYLTIPTFKINDVDYIAIALEDTLEYDGKGEGEVFVKSVEYEKANTYLVYNKNEEKEVYDIEKKLFESMDNKQAKTIYYLLEKNGQIAFVSLTGKHYFIQKVK